MTYTPTQQERINREVCRIAWPERCWHELDIDYPSDFPIVSQTCTLSADIFREQEMRKKYGLRCTVCKCLPDRDYKVNPSPLANTDDALAAFVKVTGGQFHINMTVVEYTAWFMGDRILSHADEDLCPAICGAILKSIGKTLAEVAGDE